MIARLYVEFFVFVTVCRIVKSSKQFKDTGKSLFFSLIITFFIAKTYYICIREWCSKVEGDQSPYWVVVSLYKLEVSLTTKTNIP